MQVTSQDIFNLAVAFEKLQANKNLGNGYVINSEKIDKILNAIGRATDLYLSQLIKLENERVMERVMNNERPLVGGRP